MLKRRILTAAALLAALLGGLFWLPRPGWALAVAVVTGACAWEWAGLARKRTAARLAYAMLTVGLTVWIGLSTDGTTAVIRSAGYGVAAAFWLILAPLWLWEQPRFASPVVPLAAGIATLVPAGSALIELRDVGPMLLLAVLAVVWISDTAAFFAGRRFGRRALAPRISPGKTVEGLCGAVGAVTVYAIGWLLIAGKAEPAWLERAPLGSVWFVLMMLGLALAGVAGDLLESQMKRQAEVKDSGRLLPGHGGVLDRIDAMLPVLPLAALIFLR